MSISCMIRCKKLLNKMWFFQHYLKKPPRHTVSQAVSASSLFNILYPDVHKVETHSCSTVRLQLMFQRLSSSNESHFPTADSYCSCDSSRVCDGWWWQVMIWCQCGATLTNSRDMETQKHSRPLWSSRDFYLIYQLNEHVFVLNGPLTLCHHIFY